MRRITLLTTLVLAASSAAYAEPYRDRPRTDRYDDRYDSRWDRDRDNYDRFETSHWRNYNRRWVPVARGYTGDARRQFINLRGRADFDRLRIESVRGAPVINQIAVEYTDGTTQKVRLDARLPRGSGEVIRLNRNQGINRIIVYAEPGYGGAYSVYGA
jgi:hypothetical protein